MKCPACQHENPRDTRFCGHCAAQNYEKFLALWRNADPGRHEGADVQKRLASLKPD